MRFRGTIILLVVFAVLGGYVYFAEYRGRDEREQKKAAAKKLFPVPLKDVTGITLVYPDHKLSAVKKDEKHWEITEPKGIDADSDEAEDDNDPGFAVHAKMVPGSGFAIQG